MLLQAYKPKDLIVPSDEVYQSLECADLSEYTLLRAWMSKWLNYVKWYCTISQSPGLSIQDFFKAPIVTRHWKASGRDPHLIRLGLMWRLFDEVPRWPKYFILDESKMVHHSILLGGVSGTDFLWHASWVNQPKAWKGSAIAKHFCHHSSSYVWLAYNLRAS